MLGIDNLKKIVVFAAKNETLIGKLMADKKVNSDDLVLIPEFVMALPDLISIHWSEVVPEAKDLSLVEANELIATHNEVFVLENKTIETTIETVLALIEQVTAIVMKIVAIFKAPTA